MNQHEKNTELLTKISKICQLLAWLLCIGITIYLLIIWKSIPQIIPTHFNAMGKPDQTGNKGVLIFLQFMEYMVLFICSIGGNVKALSVASTNLSGDKKSQLPYMIALVRFISLSIAILFSYINICSAQSKGLHPVFMVIAVILIFAPIAWNLIITLRMSRQKITGTESTDNTEKSDKSLKPKAKIKSERGNLIDTYHSKIDFLIGAGLTLPILMNIAFLIGHFVNGTFGWSGIIVLFILNAVLILPILLDTRYEVYDNCLHIRLSYLGNEWIPFSSILTINETHNPLSSAALSLDRLAIEYMHNGHKDLIMISPKHKKAFIKQVNELAKLNSVSM